MKYNVVELMFDGRDKPVSHRILAVVDDQSEACAQAEAFACSNKEVAWDKERGCWQARDSANRRVRFVTIAFE